MCVVVTLCCVVLFVVFFFFKQKTAYEMRISDWSSDVCSSDLHAELVSIEPVILGRAVHLRFRYTTGDAAGQNMTTSCTWHACQWILRQIGRASCRERVCQYV